MNELKRTEAEVDAPQREESQRQAGSPRERSARFPGIAAIALWMLFEALIGVMGVLTHHFPVQATPVVLALATLLPLGALGLLRMKRWGWALALAAAFLFSSFGVYMMLRYHKPDYWVMTIVNFIFFFYLVRPEILRRLR